MKPFFVLFIFLFALSCVPETNNSTVIGEVNKTISIVNPNPVLTVLLSGKDSLDLNSDGKFDIVFIKSPKPAQTGYRSETNILVKNGVQIVMSNTNNYPDSLSSKKVLDLSSNWSVGNTNTFALQSFNCSGSSGCTDYANFVNVSNKYIGFSYGKKYGWIKVDNSETELKIKEYTTIK